MTKSFEIEGRMVTFTECTVIFADYAEEGRQDAIYVHDETDENSDGDGVIGNACTMPETAEDAEIMLTDEYLDTDSETLETVEFKEDEAMTFEIYKNYGVLAAENRNVYTYGAENAYATTSDIITVELPKNDSFELYETAAGELMVEASWGWTYKIDEVLRGNNRPEFYALDKSGTPRHVVLVVR